MDTKQEVPVRGPDIDGGVAHVPLHEQDTEAQEIPKVHTSDAQLHPHVMVLTGMGIGLLLATLLALANSPH